MKTDIEILQGVWNVVSLTMDGQAMAAAALGGARIAIQGDHFTSTGMGATYEGTIEVDATRAPKTIDMKFTAGPEQGNTNIGIYEVDQYAWRICLATRGTNRPQKFATGPGTGFALEILKRDGVAGSQPAEKNAPALDLSTLNLENVKFEAVPELAGEWSMISGTLDGQPLDRNFVNAGRRLVEASGMTVLFGPQVYSKAKFTVDRSKSPMAIDYYNTQGSNAGKMQPGIYELNGKTLKLCFAAPGGERPGDFASTPGDGRTFTIWTKIQK
jgi:uncharacterized protein (TIGR03067 family)